MKIGYARVSTKHQDLATQEDQLRQLGVESERAAVSIAPDCGKPSPPAAQAIAWWSQS